MLVIAGRKHMGAPSDLRGLGDYPRARWSQAPNDRVPRQECQAEVYITLGLVMAAQRNRDGLTALRGITGRQDYISRSG